MTPMADSFPTSAPDAPRPASLLVLGYGNPGRQDDGLGVACVEALEQWAASESLNGLAFDSNYQLNVEDALAIAGHDGVLFADATREPVARFELRRIAPLAATAFTTHAMTPEAVLALCVELYGKRPAAWLLTIHGHSWEPNAAMTAEARANLAAALAFVKPFLRNPCLPQRDDRPGRRQKAPNHGARLSHRCGAARPADC